jgi:hypothetical protein
MGQGVKGLVHRLGHIFNHMVEYKARYDGCQVRNSS